MQETPMTAESPTISIRLPLPTRTTLDRAVKATRRSRSYIMKEALDRHLADIVREETVMPRKPLAHLLSMAGIAAKLGQKPRTKEDIDAHIRWLRDND
jgi:Arc/MetJ-type ribon-helix-helix transcriptional regulator